nr:hypothetical protein [Tanacetum cinerariifolium]
MPPRRRNRVNNEADPAFTAAVAQAVADFLPTLTARIIDEIRRNENNGNNGNRRNARRVNTEGSGNDGNAQPTDIHMPPRRRNRVNNEADPAFTAAVAHAVADLLPTLTARIIDEIRQNENNGNNGNRRNARRVNTEASAPVEAENWIAHIEKIFEVLGCGDQFKARLVTYKLEGDAHSWWRAYKQAKGEKCEREYKSIRQLLEETSTDFMKRFLRLAGFLGAKAGTQEEQAKHFKWGLNDYILDRILNTEFTDVAQRAYDRRDSDRYGNEGIYINKDRYRNNRGRSDRQGSDKHGNGSDKQ